MPPAESLRGLGLLTQKHLRGLVLSFLENPKGDDILLPLAITQVVTNAVGASIQWMNRVLLINVHGPGVLQQPKEFPQQVLKRSFLLRCITTAGTFQMEPSTRQLLPPSPVNGQHLNEWRETADYSATTLAMLAGIVDLETGFKSPLLGEIQMG
jgi:hypothetical protein